MADEPIVKKKHNVAIKVLLSIALVLIFILFLDNLSLRVQVHDIAETQNEFHQNLYAQVEGSYRDGAHALSVSDIYYRKYFKSKDDK